MRLEAVRTPILKIETFIGSEYQGVGVRRVSHGAVDADEFRTRRTNRRLRHSVLGQPDLTVEDKIGVAARSDFNEGSSFAPAASQRNR